MKNSITVSLFLILFFSLCYIPTKAQHIKIKLKDQPPIGTDTKDTLYYAKNRKLRWTDFTGKPSRFSAFEATTFTAFGINLATLEKKDTIAVTIYFQTYFVKNASYVKPGGKTAYNLAHEQLHFDITHWVVQDFKDSLRKTPFTSENYLSAINQMFLYFWRTMNKRQENYDRETQHGRNQRQQKKWKLKLQKKLETNTPTP